MVLNGYFKGLRIHFNFDVVGDFAMIQSYAIESYKVSHDISGAPMHLQKQEYSFGFGRTVQTKLALNFLKLETGTGFVDTRIDATNARSRYLEQVTMPLDIGERRRATRVQTAFLPKENWRVECGLEQSKRDGWVEDYSPAPGANIVNTACYRST